MCNGSLLSRSTQDRGFDQVAELKVRDGDQRRALTRLYDHSNAQVRLKAVKATLAVAPERALRQLKDIPASHEYLQADEAGMSLLNLEPSIFKPS